MINLAADQWLSRDRYPELADIPGSASWLKLAEIDRLGVAMQRYAVQDQEDRRFLLHIVDRTCYDRIKNEFEHLKNIRAQGIPAPDPICFGFCDQGRKLYMQTSWIEGQSVKIRLQGVSPDRQYALGTGAGLLLKMVHHCPIPARKCYEPALFDERCRKVISAYRSKRIRLAGERKLFKKIQVGRSLMAECQKREPLTLLHGGFVPDNLILSPDWQIHLVHFSDWLYGDPLVDLANILTWIRSVSVPFAIGVLDCYFLFRPGDWILGMLDCYASLDLIEQFTAALGPAKLENKKTAEIRSLVELFCMDHPGEQHGGPAWYKKIRKAEEQ
jgi:aminoglycoside phosphotransferase (APT) family kinase protein